jgi:hypothetical protein
MEMHEEELLRKALRAAFNARDIDGALAAMHPTVAWPNGMEAGTVHGHDGLVWRFAVCLFHRGRKRSRATREIGIVMTEIRRRVSVGFMHAHQRCLCKKVDGDSFVRHDVLAGCENVATTGHA